MITTSHPRGTPSIHHLVRNSVDRLVRLPLHLAIDISAIKSTDTTGRDLNRFLSAQLNTNCRRSDRASGRLQNI